MKIALRCIRPTWFALKVTECLCDSFQNVVPMQSGAPLSLQKIVWFYPAEIYSWKNLWRRLCYSHDWILVFQVNQYMYMIPEMSDSSISPSPHKKEDLWVILIFHRLVVTIQPNFILTIYSPNSAGLAQVRWSRRRWCFHLVNWKMSTRKMVKVIFPGSNRWRAFENRQLSSFVLH